MSVKGTITFDIIGTCFSLDKPSQKLVELGAPPYAIHLWFAQSLRDAVALSHAGHYRPFKEILQAELPRSLQMLGIETSDEERSPVLKAFAELDPHPSTREAVQLLQASGWRLLALSNGSEDSTRTLLAQANLLPFFDRILSCDAVQKTKPHPEVYALAQQNNAGESWFVAAHSWDVMGAASAGFRTAFVTQEEKSHLTVYSPPAIIASDLVDAANQISAYGSVT